MQRLQKVAQFKKGKNQKRYSSQVSDWSSYKVKVSIAEKLWGAIRGSIKMKSLTSFKSSESPFQRGCSYILLTTSATRSTSSLCIKQTRLLQAEPDFTWNNRELGLMSQTNHSKRPKVALKVMNNSVFCCFCFVFLTQSDPNKSKKLKMKLKLLWCSVFCMLVTLWCFRSSNKFK